MQDLFLANHTPNILVGIGGGLYLGIFFLFLLADLNSGLSV